ncbi:P-loop containing nucleoside triphosphate hydrolase protein [Pyronema omphalodes]|nr:P-loop containing nucleoside triphosphate hydrolase protein [Pyronema omphalodes]
MDGVTGLGLALAGPGVLDALIKTCLADYRFIITARSSDKDFECHRYKFTVEQKKLKDLITIVALRIKDSTLRTEDERFLPISSTLIRILQQFSDFRQLESLSGVQISSSNESAKKRSKQSLIQKFFGGVKSQEDTEHQSDPFQAVLTLTDLQLDERLELSTLQTLKSPLENAIDNYSKMRWDFQDSEKVEILITTLQQYNSNTEHLVNGPNNENRVGRTTAIAGTTKDKPHFTVPFPKHDNFIGQSHVTMWFKDYIKQRIASGKSKHTGHLRLAVCGPGGVGKMQDVLHHLYEYELKRPVFWIHAGSITRFEADCQKLASLAKIPAHEDNGANSELLVKRWQESLESGDWILILDNADDILDFYPTVSKSTTHDGSAKFTARGSKGTIIVTTKDREVARNFANQNAIIEPELSPEQAMELFYHLCPDTADSDDSVNDISKALQRLLKELQHLPLAIVQVAAYLDLTRSVSVSEYLNNIRRDKGGNAETILTTFAISFRQLQKQSKPACSFLRFMACIDRQAILRDLLF